MLGTFLDKLSGFFDQRFIVIYWFPTFIGLGLASALAASLSGLPNTFRVWSQLNTTQQVLLGVAVLLLITVIAFLLGTFTSPIVQFYEGYWPENRLSSYMLNHQKSVWQSNLQKLQTMERKQSVFKPDEKRTYLFYKHIQYHYFPLEEAQLKPTRLGNVLTAAEEYPNKLYAIDAVLWWPRMAALMPEAFRSQIDSALTPMLITLNLSLVFTLVAIGGEIAVLATHSGWWLLSLITFLGGLLLARVCYSAAVNQAVNYAMLIRVAFDLYRLDVLKQMHIPLPRNVIEERYLWTALNKWTYYYKIPWQKDVSISKPLKQEPFYYDMDTSMQAKSLEAKQSQPSNQENNKMSTENA